MVQHEPPVSVKPPVEKWGWNDPWYAEITKTRFGYTAHFTNGLMEAPYCHPFRFTKQGIVRKSKRWIRKKNNINDPTILLIVR